MRSYDNDTLSEAFPEMESVEPTLRSAIRYALRTEGSFGRAQLARGVALELSLSPSAATDLGTAIELLHLASLLIDDLPCMDDAAARRSRPCSHRVYGESATILAALAFITRAYALFWKRISQAPESARQEASELIEGCLGIDGILNGQALDLAFGDSDRSPAAVERVAQLKTGALLRLSLLLPSVLAGVSRYEKMHLTRLAQAWGLAYQIADDLKDVLFSEKASGKTPLRDEKLGRPNMALSAGVEEASALLQLCIDSAGTALGALASSDGRTWSSLGTFQSKLVAKVNPILDRQAVA